MPRLALVLAAASLLLPACDSGDASKGDGADAKKEASKPKPKPFEGDLTVALIEGMGRDGGGDARPNPFDPWGEALALVESKLGKPTKIDGKDHSWAVVDGDKCAYFTIEKDGDKVGVVDGPGTIDKAMKSMHDKCVVKSGAEPETPKEDPNAPVPPTDGSSVKPTVLRAGIAGAASKWVGQEVTVEGVFFSSTSAKASGSDEVTVTVSIRDDKETEGSVGCVLQKGTEAPKLMQYDPIKVTGKASDTFGGGLDDCKIAE